MKNKTKLKILVLVSVLVPGFIFLARLTLPASAAATITVNSRADDQSDDGECTLREAIIAANTNTSSGATGGECIAGDAGADTIQFSITGVADFTIGPEDGYTIQPTSGLPAITEELTIDGYTQSGASANMAIAPAPLNGVLLIEINGSLAGSANGFILEAGSDNSVLQGLVINNFDGIGIRVNAGADGVHIAGNYIGTDPTGLTQQRNAGQGVSTFAASGTTGGPVDGIIGGLLPAERNILSGNDTQSNDPNLAIGVQGISMYGGSNGWVIQGNYVGIGADGTTAIPNELAGITIDYIDDLLIGGTEQGAANVFSGNGDGGIQPDYSSNIRIKGNYIGTDYTGNNPVPNGTKGISFAFDTVDSIVGGSETGAGNTIAFNNDVGIFTNDTSNDIAIVGNSIHSNGDIGIDIDFDGQTVNDLYDADSGSNDLLNYPEYLMIEESGGDSDITYIVDLPAGDYRIEFYENTVQDPSGNGEGEVFLGYQNITSTGSGEQKIVHTLTGVTGIANLALTTTERNAATISSFGATSEFGGEYSVVDSIGDMSLSKTLLNPEDVAPGATLLYEFSVENLGPNTINLTSLQNSTPGTDSLVFDVMPTDLTYVSQDNADVTCISLGEESAAGLGPTLQDHADHEVVLCGYTGPSQYLSVGESFVFTMSVLVEDDSDLQFTNKAFISPGVTQDPDTSEFAAAFFSGGDAFTYLGDSINSVAIANYPTPVEASAPSQGVNSANGGSLTNTGQWILGMMIVGGLLIVGSVFVGKIRSRSLQ